MISSIRATIRGFVAPDYLLSCDSKLWQEGLSELRLRGEGRHESGAFLLGLREGNRRIVKKFVYYDDLDPHCLDHGIVIFDGSGFGPLWEICRETKLELIADVHTHGGVARQSEADRTNPMKAKAGHLALILPDFVCRKFQRGEIGFYEYMGQYRWKDYSGSQIKKYLYIGIWG
ncbi:MAG TPA: hypothetical protein VH186_03540 [Chloroflexia bacterium]|nr:hypothetical protein [Chloroflexia bacterium]